MGIGGPMQCQCCGEEERTSGCVRGITCRCARIEQCKGCSHCIEHHHRNCSGELRKTIEEAEIALRVMVFDLRKKHGVNIFERGVVEHPRSHNWRRD